ncbi:MAG: prepilin-type N-terminal cleavage/methylation domain-containing protein [Candidatus Sumerlaeia bacterium]
MNSMRPVNHAARIARGSRGFTLVEIMIVVAILGIIIAIAAPTWMKQRLLSQQRVCQENLTKIDGAKEQWALEYKQDVDAVPQWTDLVSADGTGYLNKQPVCPGGGEYTINSISIAAECSVVSPLDHNQQ